MKRNFDWKPRGAFARTQKNIHGETSRTTHRGTASAREIFGNSRTKRAPRRMPSGRNRGGMRGSKPISPLRPGNLPRPNRLKPSPGPIPPPPGPSPFNIGQYRRGGKVMNGNLNRPMGLGRKMKKGGVVSEQRFRRPMRGRRR